MTDEPNRDNLEANNRKAAEKYPHVTASYSHLVGELRPQAFEYGLERLLTGIEQERGSALGWSK